jgi:flavin-binding protein dodecin
MGKWIPEQHAKYKATIDRKRKRQRNATTKQTTKRNTPRITADNSFDGIWNAILRATNSMATLTLPEVADIRTDPEKRKIIGEMYRLSSEIIAAD